MAAHGFVGLYETIPGTSHNYRYNITQLRDALGDLKRTVVDKLNTHKEKSTWLDLIEKYSNTLDAIEQHKEDPKKLIGNDGLTKMVNALTRTIEACARAALVDSAYPHVTVGGAGDSKATSSPPLLTQFLKQKKPAAATSPSTNGSISCWASCFSCCAPKTDANQPLLNPVADHGATADVTSAKAMTRS